MSEVAIGVDPNAPARREASRTEVELEQLEKRREELLAKKAAEDAVKADSTFRHREGAIALHATLCPSDHASLACPWFADPEANSPDGADWTEEQHKRWLAIVVFGVQTLTSIGWTVIPPPEPESSE